MSVTTPSAPGQSPATQPFAEVTDAATLARQRALWGEHAKLIDWQTPFTDVLEYGTGAKLPPPFARWFVGGTTNLCHNALDRHLKDRGNQVALVWESTEVDRSETWTYAELHREVVRAAAGMRELGVGRGDRVLIYMPMIPEAVFAMLACARIGAIHSVVFGGFASVSLARRIDDARPRLIVSADAGSRAGKVIEYKPLLDHAIELAHSKPAHVLIVNRGLAPMHFRDERDVDWAALRNRHLNSDVPVTWLESNESSYILYTSGTTGKPKGVQRDVGGYAVALAASMRHIYDCQPGETYFCTSDIGWVVGHSYIVYGPLINGMTTILYEGTPLRPDAGVFWQLVAKHRPAVMFSSPTAIRTLKRYDQSLIRQHDISSLRALFLAGEPLDEPTARWVGEWLGCPIRDNYWQTETGWPIMATPHGADPHYGSAGQPVFGYDVRLVSEETGELLDTSGETRKGVVAIAPPLPPGCLQTVWDDDERFVRTYFHSIPGKLLYSTFDWGTRDRDGYWYILGRIDDVINVAGHRLGTREIEESICSHAAVAECAVVGVHDEVKGQVAVAFAVPRNPDSVKDASARMDLEGAVMKQVHEQLGAVARPARVHFVTGLPKTRSGKVLRRAIQAICERRDPGDLTTIDDAGPLEQVKQAHLG